MSSITTLAATLRDLATAGMTPKALMAAVRERHPESSKKDIVRAAFYALIEGDTVEPEHAKRLHGFAIGARAGDEEAPIKRGKLRKKGGKLAREAAPG